MECWSEAKDLKSGQENANDLFVVTRRHIQHNRYKEVEESLASNPGLVHECNDHGNTLLAISCQNNRKRFVKLLLRHGADINHQNALGNSALHYCSEYSYHDLGDYLISKNANIGARNHSGQTPMDVKQMRLSQSGSYDSAAFGVKSAKQSKSGPSISKSLSRMSSGLPSQYSGQLGSGSHPMSFVGPQQGALTHQLPVRTRPQTAPANRSPGPPGVQQRAWRASLRAQGPSAGGPASPAGQIPYAPQGIASLGATAAPPGGPKGTPNSGRISSVQQQRAVMATSFHGSADLACGTLVSGQSSGVRGLGSVLSQAPNHHFVGLSHPTPAARSGRSYSMVPCTQTIRATGDIWQTAVPIYHGGCWNSSESSASPQAQQQTIKSSSHLKSTAVPVFHAADLDAFVAQNAQVPVQSQAPAHSQAP